MVGQFFGQPLDNQSDYMFKKNGLFAVCAGLLFSAAASAQQITVVDWNIRSFEKSNGSGQTLVEDITEYVDFLKGTQADIITLNEFETGTSRMGKEKMAELASRLEMFAYFIKSYPKDDGFYGNVILSRWPMLECASTLLPYQHYKGEGNYQWNNDEMTEIYGADQRSVGYSDILVPVSDTESRVIRVACTHLDHQIGKDGHRKQFEEIAKFPSLANPPYPALIAGDMNVSSGTVMDPITNIGDQMYLNWVDHIFSFPNGAWEKVSGETVYSGALSDHNAVKVVLKLK